MIQTSPLQRRWMSCPSPQGAGRGPLTHRGEAGGLRKNRCGSTSPGTAFRHPGPLGPTGTSPGTRRCHRCRGRESRRWPWPSASRPLGHTAGREHQRRAPRQPRHLRSPVGPWGASPRPRPARPGPSPRHPPWVPRGRDPGPAPGRAPTARTGPGAERAGSRSLSGPALTMLRTALCPGPGRAARAAARPHRSTPRTPPAQPMACTPRPFRPDQPISAQRGGLGGMMDGKLTNRRAGWAGWPQGCLSGDTTRAGDKDRPMGGVRNQVLRAGAPGR